jgi:hypothetical protein
VVRFVILALALSLGLFLRASSLDAYGFSEDEIAKLRAVDAYRQGDFSANAEHPMLMKLAMWSALDVAAVAHRAGVAISPEAALRAPNVVAGTLSIALVGLAAALLFSPWVGLIAALLVACDPNIIAINRIGKEDTFAQLFFFAAVCAYEWAKRIGVSDLRRAKRWFNVAGACFGLMLASKYLPHLYGLYGLYNVIVLRDAGPNSPDKRGYYAAMAAAFLAADFAILLPSTWLYGWHYIQGHHLLHHGYLFAGRLYVTDVPVSASGVPATYYLEMIVTKTPLATLAAAAIGLVPLVRARGERGFVWLRVFLCVQLIGYSVVAAKFQRYGLSLLLLTDILAAVGVVRTVEWLSTFDWHPVLRRVATAGVPAAVVIATVLAALSARPFYSLHQNAIGAVLARPAAVFPEETYDYGVREAVSDIARQAGPRAAVISDAPAVVSHYAEAIGRRDLQVLSLSQSGVSRRGDEWVIVQDEHLSFENRASVRRLRELPAWREYRIRDSRALQLYHLPSPPSRASDVRSSSAGSS